MVSDQSTVDFIIEQMSHTGEARARKMFGEYGVYFGEKFVGIISDDQLYLKITEPGRALLPEAEEGAPYDGAKPHLMVSADVIEDGDRLREVARATADSLPAPKPKKVKRA
ncbi:MAG TPA: TfoX/Sxy family protein [Thermomicrobiales bacterium]|nr:TfoX/Sxy family protein [Thermomicrobiales bacterium]